jgi:hypothetical protein
MESRRERSSACCSDSLCLHLSTHDKILYPELHYIEGVSIKSKVKTMSETSLRNLIDI